MWERICTESGFYLGAETFKFLGNAFGLLAELPLSLLQRLLPHLVEDRALGNSLARLFATNPNGFFDLLAGDPDRFSLSSTRFKGIGNGFCGESLVPCGKSASELLLDRFEGCGCASSSLLFRSDTFVAKPQTLGKNIFDGSKCCSFWDGSNLGFPKGNRSSLTRFGSFNGKLWSDQRPAGRFSSNSFRRDLSAHQFICCKFSPSKSFANSCRAFTKRLTLGSALGLNISGTPKFDSRTNGLFFKRGLLFSSYPFFPQTKLFSEYFFDGSNRSSFLSKYRYFGFPRRKHSTFAGCGSFNGQFRCDDGCAGGFDRNFRNRFLAHEIGNRELSPANGFANRSRPLPHGLSFGGTLSLNLFCRAKRCSGSCGLTLKSGLLLRSNAFIAGTETLGKDLLLGSERLRCFWLDDFSCRKSATFWCNTRAFSNRFFAIDEGIVWVHPSDEFSELSLEITDRDDPIHLIDQSADLANSFTDRLLARSEVLKDIGLCDAFAAHSKRAGHLCAKTSREQSSDGGLERRFELLLWSGLRICNGLQRNTRGFSGTASDFWSENCGKSGLDDPRNFCGLCSGTEISDLSSASGGWRGSLGERFSGSSN